MDDAGRQLMARPAARHRGGGRGGAGGGGGQVACTGGAREIAVLVLGAPNDALATALAREIGRRTGLPTVPFSAPTLAAAAAKWPAATGGEPTQRAWVYIPFTLALGGGGGTIAQLNYTAASEDAAAPTSSSSVEQAALLGRLMRQLSKAAFRMITSPLAPLDGTRSPFAAASPATDASGVDRLAVDSDGTSRRARMLPRWAMKATRVAARLGGAVWLDTTTALLSARPDATALAASLIVSALETHCGSPHTGSAEANKPRATERCAVCFSGWAGVSVANGGAGLATNVVKPFGADTFLALTHHPSDHCSSVETCQVAERLPALTPFAAASVAPMLPMKRLVALMEGLPHWPSILRAYSNPTSRVSCERAPNATVGGDAIGGPSQYKCRGIYLGNTVFAPVLGSAKLHVLRQLHDIRRCLNLVGEFEASSARGVPYDRIVHTRLEYVWLRPHPPLPILSPHAVWVPSGEDYYGGVNDRHAVLSRAAAEVYMRRWDLITDGSIMRIDHQLRSGTVTNGVALQDENLVSAVLRHFHLPVRRFPGVAYLGCCNASAAEADGARRGGPTRKACFSKACVIRRLPTDAAAAAACAAEQRATTFESAAKEAMESSQLQLGKYRSEVEIAVQHALALGLPGAALKPVVGTRPRRAYPPNTCMASSAALQQDPAALLRHDCAQIAITVPEQRAKGFRALLALLKKRAFRLESEHIRWAPPSHGVME